MTKTTDPRQQRWTRSPNAPNSPTGTRKRRIGAAMDDPEYAAFVGAARRRGMSLADLIRTLVTEACQQDRDRQEATTAAVG